MSLSEIRQYTKPELGDTVIVTDSIFPEDNGPGEIIAMTGGGTFGVSYPVYCIKHQDTEKETWFSRQHFRLATRPNREAMSEAERYRYNLKHHGRGTTDEIHT